jgi:hypothetical protein
MMKSVRLQRQQLRGLRHEDPKNGNKLRKLATELFNFGGYLSPSYLEGPPTVSILKG